VKKTHEEYMALAKILGEHLGCELHGDWLSLILHFIASPSCPLCHEKFIEKK
jgi:hypothetical protein